MGARVNSSQSTRKDGVTDDQILDALEAACVAEVGAWATPLPVAQRLGVNPAGITQSLNRLVRNGQAEVWSPKGGVNKITALYRPR